MQGAQLRYVIKFVSDMSKAVKFYGDVLGLELKVRVAGMERVRDGRNYTGAASD